ncbi:hypothetical protein SRHO_G00288890 [Serrasalmus rhombeus]
MAYIKEELQHTLENLVEEELKLFQWHLINTVEGSIQIPKVHLKNANRHETVDKMVARLGDHKAVEVTLDVLKKINQNQLAEELRTKYRAAIIWENPRVKENLKKYFLDKFARLSDRTSLEDDSLLLKDIYTELYVIEGCTGGVNTEHEIRQIEAIYPRSKETSVRFSDLFKVQSDQSIHGTKVLTVGIGGVGKTATVHKFILDWAENKSNQDLDFVFFLPFRELNVIKGEEYSLLDLLNYFHCELCDEDEMKMLKFKANMIIILDGLDENKIQLDFNQKKVSSVTQKTTPDKLITNLIKGELLPSALIWITSRPAAASQIPCGYFHFITEIRGFDDSQKEEYFKKRMNDDHQASRIISHIKSVRSLYILCDIPVFCKIAATVLQKGLDGTAMENAPTTMTEMYTNFLLFQTRQKSEKYSRKENEDSPVPPVERGSLKESDILKLGKLAFLQLQKGKQIFFESDLKKCGIDVNEAAVYSGVCTQFFKREEKLFSFVHLSFQEFLAAVYVFLTFASCTHNKLLQTILEKIKWMFRHKLDDLLKTAVKKAMESRKGHLDLFVRFLLGLSLQSNQRLLKAVHPELEIKEESLKDTTDYIKKKIKKTKSSEKIINLFHCLSELKDSSLTSEIQNYLNSVDFTAEEFSPTQWSALVFVLLMSEDAQQRQKDLHCRLETLGVEHAGENRIKPGLRKYAFKITLDPNTSHTQLSVSEDSLELAQASQEQTGRVGTLIAFSTVSCSFGQGPFQQPDPGQSGRTGSVNRTERLIIRRCQSPAVSHPRRGAVNTGRQGVRAEAVADRTDCWFNVFQQQPGPLSFTEAGFSTTANFTGAGLKTFPACALR